MAVTRDLTVDPEAVDHLRLGREAATRQAWKAALAHLAQVEPAALTPRDWHEFATAAYLVADRDTAIDAWQQAFMLHSRAGDLIQAALTAGWIALVHNSGGNPTAGGGWVARGLRLLDGQPEDAEARGFFAIHEFYRHLDADDLASAATCAERILRIGQLWCNGDLMAFGLVSRGRLLVYQGRAADGLAMLDEAMTCLTTGEVSPILAGHIYCTMIEGCQEISDYRRMSEWTEALTRWCQPQEGLVPFTGQCAVHRGQLMRAHGSFREALTELDLAIKRYAANGMEAAVGVALYERGEVLRILGDLDGAEAAYEAGAGHGYEAQPGLSLVWLARGRTAIATASAHRLLQEPAGPVQRIRRLPAAVQILTSAGETEAAGAAAHELVTLAADIGCDALAAEAGYAAGLAFLAEDHPGEALAPLRRAWKTWIALGARYDAARARVQIAIAFRAMGDEASAMSELAVAERTFAELGAAPAQRETARLRGLVFPDGLTAREVEVLRLVAAGQTNPQIAVTLVLSEKTVARHLSNIFTKTAVTSRTAAATYAYRHQLL